jgi:hypothetical protein
VDYTIGILLSTRRSNYWVDDDGIIRPVITSSGGELDPDGIIHPVITSSGRQ